jgi:lipoprotein signal peptidase
MDKSAAPTTAFQFRLRTIAAAITVLAVVFAALAPWLRQYDAAQWWRFAQIWLSAAVAFLLVVVICSLLRYRAMRHGGRIHARVRVAGFHGAMATFALVAVVDVGILLWFSLQASDRQLGDSVRWVPHFLGLTIGFGTGMMSSMFFLRTGQVQLCEHGLLGGVGLIPWKSVQSWHWERSGPSRVLVMRIHLSTARFDANPDEEAAIEALLTSRVGRPDRVAG